MVGKYNRDTSSVTATPSTVTSSSAAFGRWAFGIGQLRRDRRGRTGIVKGRSVRSGGNVLTTLSCSAIGIFIICCDLTQPTTTRLARTFQSTRTRRRREQYMPLGAFYLRHFSADFIICMCVFDFRQAQADALPTTRRAGSWLFAAAGFRLWRRLVRARRIRSARASAPIRHKRQPAVGWKSFGTTPPTTGHRRIPGQSPSNSLTLLLALACLRPTG